MKVLTKQSVEWEIFVNGLQDCLDDDVCHGDHRNTIMTLDAIGGIDVASTIELFMNRGGYCDCEVVMNVAREIIQ